MRKSADVVIIGGGIQGCSIAFHLAEAGVTNVSLVEAHTSGFGSTGASAAMLMHQTGRLLTTQLARISIDEYLSYPKDESNIRWEKTGSICFATQSDKAGELRQWVEMQKSVGLSSRELSNAEVREYLPILETKDIVLSSYCPDDGYIDPHSIMSWYTAIARKKGLEINMKVEATGIKLDGRKVMGVDIKDADMEEGFIKTPVVVNAAGVWSGKIAKWVNIDLPIKNQIRNIAFLAPRPPLGKFPIVEDVVTEWYMRPDGMNILVGIGPQDNAPDFPDLLQPPFKEDCLVQLGEYLSKRAPSLTDLYLGPTRSRWAGIRCTTGDQLPILGPVDGVDGFFNCCGWSGYGVTLAPVTGRLLAEFIKNGKATTIDATPFLLKRFTKGPATHDKQLES